MLSAVLSYPSMQDSGGSTTHPLSRSATAAVSIGLSHREVRIVE